MEPSDLTPEQIDRAKACKMPEDLRALAEKEGVTLADEMVAGISGGDDWYECSDVCPLDKRV